LGIQDGPSLCSALGKNFDCDAVNKSDFAEIGGVPIAILGMLFYLVLLTLTLVATPKKSGFAGAQRWASWLAALGLLIDVALLGVQIFVVKNICIYCSATYLCTALFLVAAAQLAPGERFGERLRTLLVSGAAVLPGARMLAAGLVGAVVVGFALSQIPGVIEPKADPGEAAQIEKWFGEYEAMPRKLIVESPDDGVSGPVGAPHQLVVFSDFQCPFCRKAAVSLDKALAPYRDQVRVVFKNFPLDSSCNPALSFPLHPHACYLATQAICAARAGKFQEFHDTAFHKLSDETFAEGRDAVNEGLKSVLDEAGRRRCSEEPSVQSALRTSIELGRDMGVKGTPAFFIDGRSIAVQVNERTMARLLGLGKKPAK